MPRVSALYVYPIKSCGGIDVTTARVGTRGLEFDRRFMLVDGNGRFVTQRQLPAMALLKTAIRDGSLIVTRPGAAPLQIALRPDWSNTIAVKVWRSVLDANVADEPVNEWFSEYLGRPLRLVYMADRQHRRVARNRATRADDEVSFADGAPILLIGEGSLAGLNARLAQPLSMLRFRPNIVVDSEAPFAEDDWHRIRIDTVELELAWRCARCTLPSVDPDTGAVHPAGEPLRTLREFRRDGPGVVFGQNVLIRAAGQLTVGASVEVIETQPESQ